MPSSSAKRWSSPTRNVAVRSPGSKMADGDRKVQFSTFSWRSVSRNTTPARASGL
ncbi:hypothetical protein D3C73_1653540 [compost metagenome]